VDGLLIKDGIRQRHNDRDFVSEEDLTSNHYFGPGVFKLRPAKTFHPAREDILSMMKK